MSNNVIDYGTAGVKRDLANYGGYTGSFIQEDDDEENRSSILSRQRVSEMMLNVDDINVRPSVFSKKQKSQNES